MEWAGKECIATLKISALSRDNLNELGLINQTVRVRLIKVYLPESEETEVLMTSLIDASSYLYEEFAWLYHQRWAIEESYKSLKSQLEIENFTGCSKLCIEQDLQAKSLSKNITALIASQAQMEIDKVVKKKELKRKYKPNFAGLLREIKNNMVRLLTTKSPNTLIKRLLLQAIRERQPVRPGRKYPRIERRATLKYSMRYKHC